MTIIRRCLPKPISLLHQFFSFNLLSHEILAEVTVRLDYAADDDHHAHVSGGHRGLVELGANGAGRVALCLGWDHYRGSDSAIHFGVVSKEYRCQRQVKQLATCGIWLFTPPPLPPARFPPSPCPSPPAPGRSRAGGRRCGAEIWAAGSRASWCRRWRPRRWGCAAGSAPPI